MNRRNAKGPAAGRRDKDRGRRPQRAGKFARTSGGVSPELLDDTAAGRRISFRTAVITGAVLLVAFGLIQPASSGLTQIQQIAALEADVEATQDEVEQLQKERELLDDPEHIKRLARENLQYVHEGEEAYIVIDSRENSDEAAEKRAAASTTVRRQPWYIELADSLRAAGYAHEEEPT